MVNIPVQLLVPLGKYPCFMCSSSCLAASPFVFVLEGLSSLRQRELAHTREPRRGARVCLLVSLWLFKTHVEEAEAGDKLGSCHTVAGNKQRQVGGAP
jgi:hypothetical protein